VHAIPDQGEIPMLHELSREAGKLAAETGRHIHLVLENDDNIAAVLDPVTDPPRGQYRAQWNDDYHHAWHVALSGERQGYYSDYADTPLGHLCRALGSGFAYQGEPSAHRGGTPRGEPSGELPPLAFVNFLQNHDQIGNRALGDRLESLAKPEAIEAALAITLLAPMVPMLFMGEEWGSQAPFPFFCDFHGELAEAVRAGRRKEFAGAYEKYGDDVPDPLSENTFTSAVLDWRERDGGAGAQRLALVSRLLQIRRNMIVPRLAGARFGTAAVADDGMLTATWRLGDGSTLRLAANLTDSEREAGADGAGVGTILWGDDWNRIIPPWAVTWRLEQS
jgi:1,4-alpha-glucan branching enzyme/maltooligosyltrehalose trehalohydrolase